MEFSRQDLFEAVWRSPIRSLAEEYGVTAASISNACKVMEVPRPKRGHWTLVSMGRTPERPLLPQAHEGIPSITALKKQVPKTGGSNKPQAGSSSSEPSGSAHLPPELSVEPATDHPLIISSQKALQAAKVGDRGQLVPPPRRRCLTMRITEDSIERALGIYAFIIAAISAEADGKFKLDGSTTVVTLAGEEFHLLVREKMRTTKRPVTKEEKESNELRFMWQETVTDYFPTGVLTLKVLNHEHTGIRQAWADTAKTRVEDKIKDLVPTLRQAAEQLKEFRRRQEERKRQDALDQQQRWEQQRERERRQEKIERTFKACNRWLRARELREFLQAVQEAIPESDRDEEFIAWFDLMNQHAETLDPFSSPETLVRSLCRPPKLGW